MSAPPLSRDLALRIGLAARALPNGGLPRLMNALVDALDMPLTEAKLGGLGVGQLRAAADGTLAGVPRAALRQALGYLKGSTPVVIRADDPPALTPYAQGDMPGSIRLAVASDSGEAIDGNFATCAAFLIYQVSAGEVRLIDRRPAQPAGARMGRDTQRTALIDDCRLLYAKELGNPATARLMRTGVHPIRFPAGGQARDELAVLQTVLADHPPPWLARAMGEDWVMPRRIGFCGPLLVHSREVLAEAAG